MLAEWIQIWQKRFVINRGGGWKLVNKERGQLSVKEGGVFNDFK